MLGLFKQAKTAPSPSDTLKRLREVLDTLEKREAFLGTRVNTEREKAKKLASTNRKGMYKRNSPKKSGLQRKQGGKNLLFDSPTNTKIKAQENGRNEPLKC